MCIKRTSYRECDAFNMRLRRIVERFTDCPDRLVEFLVEDLRWNLDEAEKNTLNCVYDHFRAYPYGILDIKAFESLLDLIINYDLEYYAH